MRCGDSYHEWRHIERDAAIGLFEIANARGLARAVESGAVHAADTVLYCRRCEVVVFVCADDDVAREAAKYPVELPFR